MERPLYIYLAGNIRKGKEEENEQVWSSKEMQLLQSKVVCREIVFLNPAHRSDDLGDQKSVFGRDLFQVYSSDIILVDARNKRGLGVGAEMMFAKMNRIPVLAWVPKESHYLRKHLHLLGQEIDDWIHPFVCNLADFIAHSLEEAAQWIDEVYLTENFKPKGPDSLYSTMHYYLENQLERDRGMQEIILAKEYFQPIISTLEGLRNESAH